MISPTYNFEYFADKVKDLELFEIISLAEQEATRAWRQTYHHGAVQDGTAMQSMEYQSKLLGLIDFLRHRVKPRTVDQQDLELFHLLSEKVQEKKHLNIR